ncbi:hypothetical protein evm_002019 [Chilo suppressalis]|nr:hypothetical protein evm_002019 [Chilo suppressalis]
MTSHNYDALVRNIFKRRKPKLSLLQHYSPDLNETKTVDWTPYFENVKESWRMRNHPNMLFLFYEDALRDLPSTVKRVAAFLGKAVTEEQVSRLCEHLAFANFKKNLSVNYDILKDTRFIRNEGSFMRKGKAGGWREYFDEEMLQQAQRWMEHNLRDTDLTFPSVV